MSPVEKLKFSLIEFGEKARCKSTGIIRLQNSDADSVVGSELIDIPW